MEKLKGKLVIVLFVFISIGALVIGMKYRDPKELIEEAGCEVAAQIDISDAKQMQEYLLSGVWSESMMTSEYSSYSMQRIFIKITDNLFYLKDFQVNEDEKKTNSIESINSGYQFEQRDLRTFKIEGKCPIMYHNNFNWVDDFIEINDESFTIRKCTSSVSEIHYERVKMTKVNLDGTYTYMGKTFIIKGEDLYHQEADKHVLIRQIDNQRLYVDGQIISEVPSYRFWISEEGDIILFSEGMKVEWLEEQEILEEYPFYELKKQK